jgi:hypothetical protein
MDYSVIFRRAWRYTSRYRVLWLFGMVVALTTVSWGATLIGSLDDDNRDLDVGLTVTRGSDESFVDAVRRTVREEDARLRAEFNQANRDIEEFFAKELDTRVKSDILAVVLVVVGVMLTLYVIAKIAGYVSETALIRMVAETERTGNQLSFGEGLRLGVSRTALRIFLINVVVNLAMLFAFIALLALTLAPLLLWATEVTAAGIVGTIVSVLLFFPGLALIFGAVAVVALLKRLFRRACAIEGLGVFGSIRRGLAVARRHPVDVLPVWLAAIGVTAAWPLFVLPVAAVIFVLAALLGASAGLLVGGISSLALGGLAPWIVGALVGFPVFLLVLSAPLVFLGGLREVFLSSTWTVTYGQLLVQEQRNPASQVDKPSLGAASII